MALAKVNTLVRHQVSSVQLIAPAKGKRIPATAGLVGIGRGRTILITQPIKEHFSQRELEAVLAHEAAHDWRDGVISTCFQLAAFMFALLTPEWLMSITGNSWLDDRMDPELFLALLLLAYFVTVPLLNSIVTWRELRADLEAAALVGSAAVAEMFTHLTFLNQSNPTPPTIARLFVPGHPSLQARLINLGYDFTHHDKSY
ncbi:MAG: M48 family metalloprotease [Chloroflexi bacterium]|nr:M48 family metalloprotease [Chloroflexota bacterium]